MTLKEICDSLTEEVKQTLNKADLNYINTKITLPDAGYYTLMEEDLNRINNSARKNKIFMDRVFTQAPNFKKPISENRKTVGLPPDSLSQEEIASKAVFIVKSIDSKKVWKFNKGTTEKKLNDDFWRVVQETMNALYLQYLYKKKEKKWIILNITSTYRDERKQAEVMFDSYLLKNIPLTKDYKNEERQPYLKLIQSFYNHGCLLTDENVYFKHKHYRKHFHHLKDPKQIDESKKQLEWFVAMKDRKQQELFLLPWQYDYNIKHNKIAIIDLLHQWITASGFKSDHQLGLAMDFSKHNADQYSDFKKIATKKSLKSHQYNSGHFHVHT